MKTRIIIKLSIIVLLIISCGRGSQNIVYVKHLIQEGKRIQLEVYDSIQLEETENVIINDISNAEVDEKGNNLLITDNSGNLVVLYNYKTGKGKRFFMVTKDFSDFFVQTGCGIGPVEYLTGRKVVINSIKEQREELLKKGLNPNLAGSNFSNSVYTAKFVKDQINISALIHISCKTVDSLPEEICITNHPCLIIEDSILRFQYILPLRQNTNNYNIEGYCAARGHDFIYNEKNKKFYTTAKNEINDKFKIMDKLTSVMKYNDSCTKYETCAELPEEYLKSNLGYRLEWSPSLLYIEGSVYCAYPYSDFIYDITDEQKVIFKITNLPYDNVNTLEYLYNEKIESKKELPYNKLIDLFALRIWKLFPINNNIGIIVSSVIKNKKTKLPNYFFLQEYSTNGKLVNYTTIPFNNSNGLFRNVAYDRANSSIIIFRKHNNKGWIMEKAKWVKK
ncbi:MAG: hypothetical protein WCR42_02800 [bacterium]